MPSSPIAAARRQPLLDLLSQVPDQPKERGRRTFAQVSADVLGAVLGAWLWTRVTQARGRLVIAVDGKAVRGAKGRDGKAPHLVAALARRILRLDGHANIAAANRHHARDPQRAVNLLQTA